MEAKHPDLLLWSFQKWISMLIDSSTNSCLILYLLTLLDAVQEGAFTSVSEHNELQFPCDKGKITNMLFHFQTIN